MRYILDGNPDEVAKVIRENRIRVERGVIEFTPLQPEAAPSADEKDADLTDSKDAAITDTKEPKAAKRSKKSV